MIEIHSARVELVEADALLVPVDGQLCRLGGATAGALRAALPAEERRDEMEYVEEELGRLAPLPHPDARVIDGVARWSKLVISAAYPHNVDGRVFSAQDCAQMIRAAMPVAITTALEHGVRTLAATLIGTAYRMPADLAVRAFLDGVAAARSLVLRWSLPDAEHRELALHAAARLSLPITLC